MLKVVAIRPRGGWDEAAAIDRVTLDHDARHRRRFRFTGERGTALLLDLAEAVTLADGDGLALEDGTFVTVRAADERLMEVRAPDPGALMRLAWHIGNRHLAAELRPDAIRLRYDHVVAAMLEGLGADVREIAAPFTPESGAYARAAGHAHAHHDHDHHAH